MSDEEIPAQSQQPPGHSEAMRPRPRDLMRDYRGNGFLAGKRALITGGDSGIGRAVAAAFAKEGASIAFSYLDEHDDAQTTADAVKAEGVRCVTVAGDMATRAQCEHVVATAADTLGGIDILVNNVATQWPVDQPEDLTEQQWLRTFDVNVHSYFRTTVAALAHLPRGSAIVNTASVNGLRGNKTLIDYAASKGAVIALTQSLAQALADRGIRVNAVAPGPVWTPLIPSTLAPEKVEDFGSGKPLGRAAEPDELAPSYVFLAAERFSSYYSGEVLSALGGEVVPS